MAKGRSISAYVRDVIAPLVFPNGVSEKGDQLFGACPDCGKDEGHCSITVLDTQIVGHCYKCGWTIKKFREDNPDYEKYFSGFTKYLEDISESSRGTFEAEFYYTNSIGKTLYRKQKYRKSNGKKEFLWQTLEHDGRTWSNNLPKNQHAPIYHLDEITKAATELPEDSFVILTEGEKDADSLRSLLHLPATCLPNGAVTKSTRFHQDWFTPFKGRRVIVMGDNDQKGIVSASVLVEKLLPVASIVKKIMPSDLLGLSETDISCKKEGYDVTDYIEEVGKEVAFHTIKRLIQEAPPEVPEEPKEQLPSWVIVKVSERGNETRTINEPMFCNEFKQKHKVSRINSIYYADGEAVTDDYILKLVQNDIQKLFVEKTGRLVKQVNDTLENTCYATQPEPDDRKIYCRGSTSLILSRSGEPMPLEENVFSLTRIPVKYNPSATCPTFEKYLADLFFPEDIPAIQEFIGYCLVPCTRAQAGLFIQGRGGEGKSVLRDVIMHLFGHAAIQEAIDQLEVRFTLANLENRLVCVDDDMQTDLLNRTGTIKKLITAKEKMPVERKNKQKYETYIFARIIGIGNTHIGAKFDHSDGFYRRQLLIDCKPKTRSAEEDDSFMSDKCVGEIEGIFIWALAGLKRLMQNGYHFSVSDRMKQTIDDTKKEHDNSLSFFEDPSYIVISDDWTQTTTSADLFTAYAFWCKDNAETPVRKGTFQKRVGRRYKDCKGKVQGVNGYTGFTLNPDIRRRIDYMTMDERSWLERLP